MTRDIYMPRSKEFWIPFLASLVVNIFVIFIFLAESSMRHTAKAPTPVILLVLLPLPIALAPTIGPLALLLGLFQFPIYGALLGKALEQNKFAKRSLQIVILHLTLAAIAVILNVV